MKKINLAFLFLFLTFFVVKAQSPEFFKYQAVARHADGSILQNTAVAFRMSILQGSTSGTVVFSERHTATTNQFGIVNLSIGNGILLSGSFTAINWSSGVYFIKTEMDPAGGVAYQNMGTSQLLSVPYALYATKSGNGDRWLLNGSDLFSGNTGNVGIGLTSPTSKLHIVNPSGASSAKIGISATNFDNRLYFGDGDYVYVGEREIDDRLYLRGGSLSIDVAGNLGSNGQVLTSNGTTVSWQDFSAGGSWLTSGQNIYNPNTGNVGVGTVSPNSKLEVKATTSGLTDTLFQVKDYQGNTVFAVFPDGARLYVKEGARAAVGGFAVSGRSSNRAVTGDYLLVTPDSTRVYVKEGARAAVGGFAVSGRSSNRPTTTSSFMHLTPENYFIGHESGSNITSGLYNSFLGYQAGKFNAAAPENVFIGYQAGMNTVGDGMPWWEGGLNVFIGTKAGYTNITGGQNIAIGDQTFFYNTNGDFNVAIGQEALFNNTSGSSNIALGKLALSNNTIGNENMAIGGYSLNANTIGNGNIAVGGLANNISGNYNSTLGLGAANQNTTGEYNIGVGVSSLDGNQTGSYNTSIGYNSGFTPYPSSFSNSSMIGNGATVDASNKIRLGNTSISHLYCQVNLTATSDGRYKMNVKEDVPGLAFIEKLRPVTYNMDIHVLNKLAGVKDSGNWEGKYDIEKIKFSGFIAQEVEAAANQIGYDFSGIDKSATTGVYGLRYAEFTVPMVKAIQELQKQIEELKSKNLTLSNENQEIIKLQAENELLKSELEEIKKYIGFTRETQKQK